MTFPPEFFRREDERPDTAFYGPPRFVTHIDDGAITAVGELYDELGIPGTPERPTRVLDLMSSWVSHLRTAPAELVVLGMNSAELQANPIATERVVQDLNADPNLPFPDSDVDAVLCCVSVDYLTRPVEVIREAARVLRPGGMLVVTFSNRCFPSKAIYGWLVTDDHAHGVIVETYVEEAGGFDEPVTTLRTPDPQAYQGDPLYATVAVRSAAPSPGRGA